MVDVSPFKGITYNSEKIKNLDKVMSPPYDIISEEMQNKLYDSHPNNFVRLILGKQFPDDNDENNRYTRAKKLFDEWQKQGIFKQSEKTAFYPYKIDYKLKNQKKTMNGFFVLLKIDPEYKTVKAHEKTLAKPKADRLNLMRACEANLEPIELLYIDKEDKIRKNIDKAIDKPIIKVKGYDGFTHTLWELNDEKVINEIVKELKNKELYIADGHHRYQTSINFAQEKKEKTGVTDPDAPFNYIMVIIANIFDPGLSILPTHRLVKMPNFRIGEFLEKMRKHFDIEEKTVKGDDAGLIGKQIMKDIETKTGHKFALYHKKKYYVLTLKDEKIMDVLASDHSKTWRTLDVSILHKLILEQGLGINDKNIEDHVKYTRVDGEAVKFVDEGRFDVSFLINATKIEELKAIAEAGEHMPQKSTYFLPKMLSGLVLYKM
ncbi:MAG: DUF1015 domain-containing protein [Candidatus Thermoplasmatota archaeon]|jgi:uncharacterized protein (DUF1015 family)|nr:DUF1015 domain-containing protein [Candidatus Thermoplasmatota archaeon]